MRRYYLICTDILSKIVEVRQLQCRLFKFKQGEKIFKGTTKWNTFKKAGQTPSTKTLEMVNLRMIPKDSPNFEPTNGPFQKAPKNQEYYSNCETQRIATVEDSPRDF